jgi:dipeptidyl aminopeptidase/acylaminoacyl peptidase
MISLLLAFGSFLPAIAQQGQYHVTYAPFNLASMKGRGGLATYSRLGAVSDGTIQLRSDDGQVYSFTLDAGTIYCQGNKRVSDWAYLRRTGKKATITIFTNDTVDKEALVIWDRGPYISMVNGTIVFALPALCK